MEEKIESGIRYTCKKCKNEFDTEWRAQECYQSHFDKEDIKKTMIEEKPKGMNKYGKFFLGLCLGIGLILIGSGVPYPVSAGFVIAGIIAVMVTCFIGMRS